MSARNQRLSAFIRGSNSGSLDYWNIQAEGLVKIHKKKGENSIFSDFCLTAVDDLTNALYFTEVHRILSRMDSRMLALLCRDLANNKKADNVVVLDVRNVSSVTDFFVVASGSSEPHLRALESEIRDRLREEHAIKPTHAEGNAAGRWIVIDYFDVIVHLMHPEVREKYDLEGLWSDALKIQAAEKPASAKKKVKSETKPKALDKAAPRQTTTKKVKKAPAAK